MAGHRSYFVDGGRASEYVMPGRGSGASVQGVDMNKSIAFSNFVMAGPPINQRPIHQSVRTFDAHTRQSRRLFLMRNAERVDHIFPEWMSDAFVAGNKYRPYDMNLPLNLSPRASFPESYRYDAPITVLGAMTAQMIGRGFTTNKLQVQGVISSPSLRCMQTAHNIIKAMGSTVRVGVETSLFDWLGWCKQVPIWMDDTEMNSVGFPVNGNYGPVETRDTIHERKSESYIDFQKRVVTTILDKHKDKNNLILVTHAATMDAIARSLLGQRPVELWPMGVHYKYPFCSLVAFEEQGGKWKMINDAIPNITYLDYSNAPQVLFGE